MMNGSRMALVVLGMHRSGTSALAGTFARLGFGAPRLALDASEDNPGGFYESAPVVKANYDVLQTLGAFWNDCFNFDPERVGAHMPEAIVAKLAGVLEAAFDPDRPPVLKDPRMCVLFPLWARVFARLEMTAPVLLMLRHPAEVTDSLVRRNGLPATGAAALTLHHMLEAERATRNAPRALLSYDELLDDWQGLVRRAVRETGLNPPRDVAAAKAEIEAFLDQTARHHNAWPGAPMPGAAPVARLLEQAWKALVFLARVPGDGMSMAVLDHVHGQFRAIRKNGALRALIIDEAGES
ncbi:sulfotransferase family protein [Acidocella sp.]|nr:hypothetical protein [Acidocella sp.]